MKAREIRLALECSEDEQIHDDDSSVVGDSEREDFDSSDEDEADHVSECSDECNDTEI